MLVEMKKRLAAAGVVAACAACCAPLLLPMRSGVGVTAAGAAGAGALFGLSADAIICGGLAVGLLTAIGVWTLLQRRKRSAAAPRACASSGACGCATSEQVQATPNVVEVRS
jgi:hypothetical protein